MTIAQEEIGRVVSVVDGDTIYVEIDGQQEKVRYIGINAPERKDPCFKAARKANARMVEGKTVRLVPDVDDRDPFGRLLRYVYVDDLFVNEQMIKQGYAEAVLFGANDRYYQHFVALELEAAMSRRGCHPTGIFDDHNRKR